MQIRTDPKPNTPSNEKAGTGGAAGLVLSTETPRKIGILEICFTSGTATKIRNGLLRLGALIMTESNGRERSPCRSIWQIEWNVKQLMTQVRAVVEVVLYFPGDYTPNCCFTGAVLPRLQKVWQFALLLRITSEILPRVYA
jgi:hypothetical protein